MAKVQIAFIVESYDTTAQVRFRLTSGETKLFTLEVPDDVVQVRRICESITGNGQGKLGAVVRACAGKEFRNG